MLSVVPATRQLVSLRGALILLLYLDPTLSLALNVLDLVTALAHHVFDLVGWQLQLKVGLLLTVTVWS